MLRLLQNSGSQTWVAIGTTRRATHACSHVRFGTDELRSKHFWQIPGDADASGPQKILWEALFQGLCACSGNWRVEKTLKTPRVRGEIVQKQQVATMAKGLRQIQESKSNNNSNNNPSNWMLARWELSRYMWWQDSPHPAYVPSSTDTSPGFSPSSSCPSSAHWKACSDLKESLLWLGT